ncbi:LisH domain-containing protein FOPNL [Lamellibrachia satsuma]|nr:LisH domain-containing protein FOPNL [Lamellibrachia satsuma]
MATIQELKTVVKDTLEDRGVLGQIKARIRAEVFHALEEDTEPAPPLGNENMFINELIREYFEFNKYKYSLSVMLAESGQPSVPLDRKFMAQELSIDDKKDMSPVPLLYSVVAHFLSHKQREEDESASAREWSRQRPEQDGHHAKVRVNARDHLHHRNVWKQSDISEEDSGAEGDAILFQ